MVQDSLNEREFELVNIVGTQLAANQRELSRQMNLSLGMTNMLLRRLVTKGYIRITQLNQKKAQYLLTPKGFAEKMRKSVKYTLKTINSITLIKEKLIGVLSNLIKQGHKDFIVVGKSDLAFLIDVVLKEISENNFSLKHVDTMPSDESKAFILICKEDIPAESHSVNLIHELAKDRILL